MKFSELLTFDEFYLYLKSQGIDFTEIVTISPLCVFTDLETPTALKFKEYVCTNILTYHLAQHSITRFLRTDDIDSSSSQFVFSLSNIIQRNFDYLFKKYSILNDLYSELSILNKKSSSSSKTKGSSITAGGNTQRQATTPTALSDVKDTEVEVTLPEVTIEGVDTPTTAKGKANVSGFANKYTNYQGTSSSVAQDKQVRENEQERIGSVEELMNNIDKLTRSLGDEIIEMVSPLFVSLVDEDLIKD